MVFGDPVVGDDTPFTARQNIDLESCHALLNSSVKETLWRGAVTE